MAPVFTPEGWLYASDINPFGDTSLDPGDWVEVIQASHALSVTVTELNAWADAENDAIVGRGAIGSALTAYLFPASRPEQQVAATTTVGIDGAFAFDLTSLIDVQAMDSGFVRQTIDASRTLSVRFVAPQIRVHVGTNVLDASVAPGRAVTVSVLAAGTVLTEATGLRAQPDGSVNVCLGTCLTSDANPVWFLPGRQVSISAEGQTITMTVPALTAYADLATHIVHGSTEPGASLSVLHWTGPVSSHTSDRVVAFDPASMVTASVTGEYEAAVPLEPRDYGAVVARDAQGNLGYRRYTLPGIHVVLGTSDPLSNQIFGQASALWAPITISVQGPSGLLKNRSTGFTSDFGELEAYSDRLPWERSFGLAAGDVITFEVPTGVDTVLQLPQLSATADVSTQHISGTGPAGDTIHLLLLNVTPSDRWPKGYATDVIVGADGTFAFDLTDVSLAENSTGYATWISPEGNEVTRYFTTRQSCLPLVGDIAVHGNSFQIGDFNFDLVKDCSPFTYVSLKNSQGDVKAQTAQWLYGPNTDGNIRFVDAQGLPVTIQPSDHLVVSNGAQSRDWLIPDFSVTADAAADLVTGTAPANARVSIWIAELGTSSLVGRTVFTVDVGADGRYAVSADIHSGALIQARLISPESSLFLTYATIPGLAVTLYRDGPAIELPPLADYSVSLQTTRPVTVGPITGRADDQGRPNSMPSLGAMFPGDRLTVQASGWSHTLTIPTVTARYDEATHRIRGQAPPNRPIRLTSNRYASPLITSSDAVGHYEVVLPAALSDGDLSDVVVVMPGGDLVGVEVGPVRWSITIGSHCLDVALPGIADHMTLVQRAVDGVLKGQAVLDGAADDQRNWQPCLMAGQEAMNIERGDHLTLTVGSQVWTYDVPELSARHDPVRKTVTGLAPAGGTVVIYLPGGASGGSTVRMVPVDGSGVYGADVSDAVWESGQQGLVISMDSWGNVTQQAFWLGGIQHWLPIIGHP